MTTQDGIYSTAEPDVHKMKDKDEKEAILKKDTTKLKQLVTFYRQRTRDLQSELKNTYQGYIQKRRHYNNNLINEEKEIIKINEEIEKVETNLEILKTESEFKTSKMVKKYNRISADKVARLQTEYNELVEENREYRARYRAIQAFESRKRELEMYNQNLREKILEEKTSIKKFAKELETKKKRFIQEINSQNQKIIESQTQTKELKKNTAHGKKALILEKNKHDSKVGNFINRRNNLKTKNLQFKVGAIVDKDTIDEYQHLNFKQSKKIKSLQTEVQYIKYRLSDELYKFANQVEIMKQEKDQILETHRNKIDEILEHIKLKTKEISNLRFLSKATIEQKKNITNFFMESLNFVKEKIEKEQHRRWKQNSRRGLYNGKRNKFPYTKNGKMYWNNFSKSSRSGMTEQSEKSSTSLVRDFEQRKVDFGDLNWKDKEKILRSLYAKVNTGVNVQYWKKMVRKVDDGRYLRGEEEFYEEYEIQEDEDDDDDIIMLDV